jgi:hypothetical protein
MRIPCVVGDRKLTERRAGGRSWNKKVNQLAIHGVGRALKALDRYRSLGFPGLPLGHGLLLDTGFGSDCPLAQSQATAHRP